MVKTSREAIVASAGELFREHGYHATTLSDIANRVGILKGSLYHHISSKEELLIEIAAPPITKMVKRLHEIADVDEPSDRRLSEAIKMHIQYLHDDYPHIFVYLQEQFGADDSDILSMSREYQHLLIRIIGEGIEDRIFRDDLEPRLVVLAILGACNWLHKWYQPDSEWDIEDIRETFASLMIDGLRT